uniref:CD48 antigen n=1 Tax=Sparus aurata TaxID=8175 RepID=A0A0E3EKL9_SPAAU|nr:CD48 antigen [Sparus aurata]
MEKQITVWISSVLLLASLNFSQAKVISTYFEVGGKLTLRPTVTETIDNILWKYNGNLLAEWVKGEVELLYYDKYKGRTTLNITSGQLEINNMVKDDVGSYTVEINNKVHGQSYDVKWITRVRKPSVVLRTLTCGPDSGSCLFTCEVKEADSLRDAEPIEYSWKMGEKAWETMTKDVNITSDQTKKESIKTVSCRISNPVSLEDSQLKENPMYTEPPPPPTPVGLIVGCTLCVLILIVAAAFGLLWIFNRELALRLTRQCGCGNDNLLSDEERGQ